MEELFHAYLRSGLWGSVIIVLVLLLRLCLKKAPRQLVCILWILVAARLVLPFVLESPLSLQPELPSFSDIFLLWAIIFAISALITGIIALNCS